MLIFTGTKNGRKLLGLGLSELNIKLLKEGRPIDDDLDIIGLPGMSLMVVYGKTEDAIARMIESESGTIPPRVDARTNRDRAQGFGGGSSKPNPNEPMVQTPLLDAAEMLLQVSDQAGSPLIVAMHPAENSHGLQPGDMQESKSTEILPSCNGLVVAVSASAEESQELLDLISLWQDQRVVRSRA